MRAMEDEMHRLREEELREMEEELARLEREEGETRREIMAKKD